jgi:NTE family protein
MDGAAPKGRALVLGGGGVTGIAWELALIEAWNRSGVELRTADLVVGTSAGSTVAAQLLSGAPLETLVAVQLDPESKERLVELDLEVLIDIFVKANDASLSPQERCARVGAMALAASTVDEPTRHEIVAARLPTDEWPDASLRITAVDVATGELVVFDRASGVGLVDAVAASCAVPGVWPPVTIGGRRYMDGGVRSPTNAALASGHERVLILSPLASAMTDVAHDEADELRAAGTEVLVIAADEASLAEMGPNPLDPSMRPAAVAAGRRQAALSLDAVRSFWPGGTRSARG